MLIKQSGPISPCLCMHAEPFGGQTVAPSWAVTTVKDAMSTGAGESALEAAATCFDAGHAEDGTLAHMVLRLDAAGKPLEGVAYCSRVLYELTQDLTRFNARLPSGKFQVLSHLNTEDALPFLLARKPALACLWGAAPLSLMLQSQSWPRTLAPVSSLQLRFRPSWS